jgi:pimeloyl-ACP methyl ester carboxylesterase
VGSFLGGTADRAGAIARAIETTRAIGSPIHFDEERARDKAARAYDRNADSSGTVRQLLAVMASPSRTEALAAVTAPTLVIHGELDPLVQPSGGVRTAEAVPGAELHLFADMAHDVEPPLWPDVVPLIHRHTGRAPVTS